MSSVRWCLCYWHGLTLIPAWISNFIYYKVLLLIMWHWQVQGINQTINPQKILHTGPSPVNYEVSFASNLEKLWKKWSSQMAKFMGPTWGTPGSCRPQMGPMLAPWTLLTGLLSRGLTVVTWLSPEIALVGLRTWYAWSWVAIVWDRTPIHMETTQLPGIPSWYAPGTTKAVVSIRKWCRVTN